MKKPLVLVVDDSFLNRKFISDALSFEDIDVLEAGSGIGWNFIKV